MPLRTGSVFSSLLLPHFCSLLKAWKCLGKLGGIIVKECVRVPALGNCTLSAPLGII